MSNVNKRYLQCLSKYPLLTKSVTTALLAVLNEQIASFVSKDLQYYHKLIPLNNKILLMALYGGLINAPIAHYGYQILNRVIKPVSAKKKLLQLLVQLVTIAPLLASVMISYITLINNLQAKDKMLKIKNSLRSNLLKVLKTSWLLNIGNLTIAQNFIKPELWVIFFNFNFFVMGTYQNTMLKLKLQNTVSE